MSDFDSGDDLFDGVDADNILQSSQPHTTTPQSKQQQPTPKPTQVIKVEDDDDNDFDDGDDLFGTATAEELLTPQRPQPGKRKLDADEPHIKREDSPSAKKPRIKLEPGEEFVPDLRKLDLAKSILKEKFGHREFRLEQEAAISRTLHGRSTMVIFPTGGGKSLCYQVPALAFEMLDLDRDGLAGCSSGISIVVSPLLALMKDQVDALQRRGIAAESLDSTKTMDQQQAIGKAMQSGALRLLYCAPERLNNEGFIESVKRVAGGVRLVAVDEAHCISEWGHQFRPDYLKVARFVREIKAERAICLTATATSNVVDDVCAAFDIAKSDVFRTSPYRPNLKLLAQGVPAKEKKFAEICKFLKNHAGATLVYVSTRDDTEQLARSLAGEGFNAKPFHAGLKTDEKQATQELFMSDQVQVVVATIAFGMGIDKRNIRNIVHYGIPGSVEEYSQQIGRAGRDGEDSTCMFFLCPDDMHIRESFARGDTPSKQNLVDLLHNIFDDDVARLPVDGVFKRSHSTQSREYFIGINPLGVIYAKLELRFGLIRAITPEYGEYKFEPTPRYKPTIANDRSREGRAIAEHATMARKYCHIDVNHASRTHGINRQDLIGKLNQLNARGVIILTATGIENRYRTLTTELPHTPAEIDDLASQLLVDLETREEDAMRRISEVIGLVTRPECFALSLARHFDMDLPDDKKSCGHCTFCIDGKAAVMPPRKEQPLSHAQIAAFVDLIYPVYPSLDDPRFLACVAFGIVCPRVSRLKLSKNPMFGSMEGHDFKGLVREFTQVCENKEEWEEKVKGGVKTEKPPSSQQKKGKSEPSSSSEKKVKSEPSSSSSQRGRGRGRGGGGGYSNSSAYRNSGYRNYDGMSIWEANARSSSTWQDRKKYWEERRAGKR